MEKINKRLLLLKTTLLFLLASCAFAPTDSYFLNHKTRHINYWEKNFKLPLRDRVSVAPFEVLSYIFTQTCSSWMSSPILLANL
jgi:hypothetical protein